MANSEKTAKNHQNLKKNGFLINTGLNEKELEDFASVSMSERVETKKTFYNDRGLR